ncbi:MAG TPA: SpoIID/LytB domain-containing protein [Gemmatimonadales bacterium]|nr:SpoIID/LytB domain-containing protein [Gemmatimonadales bacterium]
MRRRLTPILLVAAAAGVVVASCGPKQPPPPPAPEPGPAAAARPPAQAVVDSGPGGPPVAALPPDTVVSTTDIRIGILVGGSEVSIGGADPLVMTDPAGVRLQNVIDGAVWRVRLAGGAMTLTGPGGVSGGRVDGIVITPLRAGQFVRIDGRDYRGEVSVIPSPDGLTVINRLGIESYLAGVLSAEMGRRAPSELQALYAQAVISRTYAVRNMGKRRALGFDLHGTVSDQVYGGVGAETAQSWDAVRATRGQIVTWKHQPIDAFFYSTCGGRTESGAAVFQLAGDPYLKSVRDTDADGLAYCRFSPRFRWREEYSGDSLEAVLRRTLPGLTRLPAASITRVDDVKVTRHTPSGRVDAIEFRVNGQRVTVTGQAVRRAFLLPDGGMLRSTAFEVQERADGSRVSWLAIDGRGAGHGVGFCQWGAVGRAREGQQYGEILAAYYPSTSVEQLP